MAAAKASGIDPDSLLPLRSMSVRVVRVASDGEMVPTICGCVLGRLMPVMLPSCAHAMVLPQVQGSVPGCQLCSSVTWSALVIPLLKSSRADTLGSGGGGEATGVGDGDGCGVGVGDGEGTGLGDGEGLGDGDGDAGGESGGLGDGTSGGLGMGGLASAGLAFGSGLPGG